MSEMYRNKAKLFYGYLVFGSRRQQVFSILNTIMNIMREYYLVEYH